MSEVEVLPELKQIVGALLFVAKAPVPVAEMRRVLQQVAEAKGGPYRDFASVSEKELRTVMEQLQRDLEQARAGIHVAEVANGFRLQNDAACGPWLRQWLAKGRANRLSKPALETLAIIAYRQPVPRSEIEGVRGVAVDQILRNLMEMQLIRIVGRSELPGRPWLFGTTQKFLEFFGLRDVKDLPGVEELRRIDEARRKEEAAAEAPAAESEQALVPGEGDASMNVETKGDTDVEEKAVQDDDEEEEVEEEEEYDDEDDEDEEEDDEADEDDEEEKD